MFVFFVQIPVQLRMKQAQHRHGCTKFRTCLHRRGRLQFPLVSLAPTTNQGALAANASPRKKGSRQRLGEKCGRGSRLSLDPVFSPNPHRQRMSATDRALCAFLLVSSSHLHLHYPCATFWSYFSCAMRLTDHSRSATNTCKTSRFPCTSLFSLPAMPSIGNKTRVREP